MRADRVRVLKPGVKLIDIDSGAVRPELKVGKVFELATLTKDHPLPYYLIKGTREGAISRFWEDAEKKGRLTIVRVPEDGDVTLDGIPLPITAETKLSEHQRHHLVAGYLIKGRFRCTRCALGHGLVHPAAIAVYPCNVLPYSQSCHECGTLVFNVWQSKKGGPLNLFD